MSDKIKLGMIGAGSWAVSNQIRNLMLRPEVELTVLNRLEPDIVNK